MSVVERAQGMLFGKKHDLKKQSQFLDGQNDVKLAQAMAYRDYIRKTQRKNKANSLAFGVPRSEDCVKMRKSNLKKQSQFGCSERD